MDLKRRARKKPWMSDKRGRNARDKDGELILGSPNLWTDKYGLNVELDGLRISLSGKQLSLRYELGDVIEAEQDFS